MSNIYNHICNKLSELTFPDTVCGIKYAEAPFIDEYIVNQRYKPYVSNFRFEEDYIWLIYCDDPYTEHRLRYKYPFRIIMDLVKYEDYYESLGV